MTISDRARQRFFLINLVRISGVALILAGIAVLREALPLPAWAGYGLIAAGLVETFLMPTILARRWKTPAP